MEGKLRDIDQGWAWVAMAGTALWNGIIAGTQKSFGVVYVEMLEIFGGSPSQTAWMGFAFSFCSMSLPPITGYLNDRYNIRISMFIVSLLAGVSMAATAFTPTLGAATFTYGVLTGTLAGYVDGPYLGIFSQYFQKKRALATGIAFSGSSMGSLLLPLLIRWSADEYSGRGAMLILGGVWLHACVVCALLPPPPAMRGIISEMEVKGSNANTNARKTEDTPEDNSSATLKNMEANPEKCTNSSDDCIAHQHTVVKDAAHTSHKKCDTLTNQLESTDDAVSCHSKSDGKTQGNGCSSILCELFRDYGIFLKNPKLVNFVIILILCGFSYFSQIIFWPPWALERGLTKMEASLLVTIAGITELVTRPLVGLLATKVNKRLICVIANLVTLVLCLLVYVIPYKSVVMAFAGVFGCFGGVTVALGVSVLTDAVGPDRISSAAGLFPMAVSLGAAIGAPVLGYIKELTGYYVHSLRISLLGYGIASVMLIWELRHYLKKIYCSHGVETSGEMVA